MHDPTTASLSRIPPRQALLHFMHITQMSLSPKTHKLSLLPTSPYPFPSPKTPQEGSSHLPREKRYILPHCLFPIYHLRNQLVKSRVSGVSPHYTRSFERSRLSLSCPPSLSQHPGCASQASNSTYIDCLLSDIVNLWLLLNQGVKDKTQWYMCQDLRATFFFKLCSCCDS